MDKIAEAVDADAEWRESLEYLKQIVTSPEGVQRAIAQLRRHIATSEELGDTYAVSVMRPYLEHFEALAKGLN